MATSRFICFSLVFLLLLSAVSSAAISQFFDHDGNIIRSDTLKRAGIQPAALRYAVPDGIELLNDIKYEYYLVFGKTFTEIIISSQENGPLNKEINIRLPSKSVWNISWTYDFGYAYTVDEEARFVHITVELYDINIDYDITITLPALLDDTALNPVEKTLWKNYLLRILQHEHDHVKIIKDPESREALLKSFSDVNYFIVDYKSDMDMEKILGSSIKEETLKAGREWIKKIKARSDEYDRTTDYGRKNEMRESFFKKKPSD